MGGAYASGPGHEARGLHRFAESHVDQVMPPNQAGSDSNADIVSSPELFVAEVMVHGPLTGLVAATVHQRCHTPCLSSGS